MHRTGWLAGPPHAEDTHTSSIMSVEEEILADVRFAFDGKIIQFLLVFRHILTTGSGFQ